MNRIGNKDYATLLEEAARFHGHVCGGIESGTRMAICGMQRIGITDPKGADRKKLVVFVEVDRCATDAIMATTGCTPGKRSLKILDHGKMAATFINIETGKAYRLASKMKDAAAPDGSRIMPDFATANNEELFNIMEVTVPLRPEDLPGKPVRVAQCASCGEKVMDGREVEADAATFCKPCFAKETYYRPIG